MITVMFIFKYVFLMLPFKTLVSSAFLVSYNRKLLALMFTAIKSEKFSQVFIEIYANSYHINACCNLWWYFIVQGISKLIKMKFSKTLVWCSSHFKLICSSLSTHLNINPFSYYFRQINAILTAGHLNSLYYKINITKT